MTNYNHSAFYKTQFNKQVKWRSLSSISTTEWGYQHIDKKTGLPNKFPHIVPFENWKETLFEGIRTDLTKYIDLPGQEINAHDGVNNLLSSWVLCANLYFLARINNKFRGLLAEFLKLKVSDEITEISEVELEFAFSEGDELHPMPLLGERNGTRGKNQTSPDVVFFVNTTKGKGIILTECKYTEHHFYPCSTNPENDKYKNRNLNPDFSRCMHSAKGYDYKTICHQTHFWGRKYMELINFSHNAENVLNNCPAASDGYQLFRQQTLAEGIAQSGRFDLIASTVAFDGRNEDLIHCLKSTGIDDFQVEWATLFEGKALFKTWTHQEWATFVRDNQKASEFDEWLDYLKERYGY